MSRLRGMVPPRLGTGQMLSPALGKTWRGAQFLGDDWQILDRGGDASNGEAQYYQPGNVDLDGNGRLRITAKVETHGGFSYTSGMLQWKTYGWKYGTLKCRAQICGGTGTWPAIWLLGTNCEISNVTSADNIGTCSWPDPGSDEVDFIEYLNSDYTEVNQQVHMTAGDSGGTTPLGFNPTTGFHDYELVWTPKNLIWKIDGSVTQTLTSPANPIPANPLFVIMNIAMGGIGGGTISNGTLPQSMIVDYVTVIP